LMNLAGSAFNGIATGDRFISHPCGVLAIVRRSLDGRYRHVAALATTVAPGLFAAKAVTSGRSPHTRRVAHHRTMWRLRFAYWSAARPPERPAQLYRRRPTMP
jgi:hypothetical protein